MVDGATGVGPGQHARTTRASTTPREVAPAHYANMSSSGGMAFQG